MRVRSSAARNQETLDRKGNIMSSRKEITEGLAEILEEVAGVDPADATDFVNEQADVFATLLAE